MLYVIRFIFWGLKIKQNRETNLKWITLVVMRPSSCGVAARRKLTIDSRQEIDFYILFVFGNVYAVIVKWQVNPRQRN